VIGETVGSYKIVQKLGEGGMGEVYLAEHRYIARRAAIKFLLKELTSSEEVFNRFFTEARAASLIQHPGIIEVQDCGVHTDGRAYMIMEFLNGESVRGYLDRTGNMERDRSGALAILRQVAGALGAAHAQGIVHRDLKPDNVFLHLPSGRPPSDPSVKVLDFGIAKLIGGAAAGSKTRTGNLLGTPLYMSPEQCRGSGKADDRSDIYSLGCIMYELCCGQPPFVAEGLGDLIVAHISLPPPDPQGVSAAVRAILLGCLAKDPNQRPQSMAEVARLLTEAGAPDIVRLKTPAKASVQSAMGPTSGIASPVGMRSPLAPTPTPAPYVAPTTLAPSAKPQPAPITAMGVAPTTLGQTASELFDQDLPARGNRRKLAIGGAALGAAALIGFLVIGRGGGHSTSDEHTAPVAAPAATPAAAAAPVPAPAPAPAPTLAPAPAVHQANSRITLTGLPPGAEVQLDGRPAALPLEVPKGPDKHRVTVSAGGFLPADLSIDGSQDQTLSVLLKKASVAGDKVGDKPSGKAHHKAEHRSGGFSGFSDL
jgi:eukaryotic-like serine/threonine-protein kinase